MPTIIDFYPSLLAESTLSKDTHRRIAACAFDKELGKLATGWNGLARGVIDKPERFERPLKEGLVIHAEMNMICNAARQGVSLRDSRVLVTEMQPCTLCTSMLIQVGIKEVWFPSEPTSGKPTRIEWLQNFNLACIIAAEAGMRLISFDDNGDCREY